MMGSIDRVSRVLSASNLASVVDGVRRECDAIAAALLSCSADAISVVAASPPATRDAGTWLACADDCLTVMDTGVPLERRSASGDGELTTTIICPADGAAAFRGVIALRRGQPFSSEDVDFLRLLGIELGAAADGFMTPRDDGVPRRRAAGE